MIRENGFLFARTGFEAVFSDDGRYRYQLTRQWVWPKNRPPRTLGVIMLNPSTADETKDDPTIRRDVDFAKRWGFERLLIGNLFGHRSPYPKTLLTADDPVGPGNDVWLRITAGNSDMVLVAWGQIDKRWKSRAVHVQHILAVADPGPLKDLYCLGRTKSGQPRHPLMLRSDTQPEIYKLSLGRMVAVDDGDEAP